MTTRMRRVREERGLSGEQLAEMAGCTHRTIYNYETGRTKEGRPSVRRRIEAALGVPIDVLLLPENENERPEGRSSGVATTTTDVSREGVSS